MRTLFLLFWFLSGVSYAQTVIQLRMKVERVPMNHYDTITYEVRDVLMVDEDKYLSIYTGLDTLVLKLTKPSQRYDVYIDILHDDQVYFIIREKGNMGFYLGIIPIPPYTRKVWGISLMTLDGKRE